MAYVFGPVTSSDEQSASATIAVIPSFLHSFELNPPTTGLATLKIYDSENATLTGKKMLLTTTIAAGTDAIHLALPSPRVANRGLRVELTGTTTYIVGFSLTG